MSETLVWTIGSIALAFAAFMLGFSQGIYTATMRSMRQRKRERADAEQAAHSWRAFEAEQMRMYAEQSRTEERN